MCTPLSLIHFGIRYMVIPIADCQEVNHKENGNSIVIFGNPEVQKNRPAVSNRTVLWAFPMG